MNVVEQLSEIIHSLPDDADVARDVLALLGTRADTEGHVTLDGQDALELANWLVRLDVKISQVVAAQTAA